MIQIFLWSFNAGSSWNPLLEAFCIKYKIPYIIKTDQKEDLIISYYPSDYRGFDNTPPFEIAVELKYKDLHSSLMGHGEGGNLLWELINNYLPKRKDKKFQEVWVVVAADLEEPFSKLTSTLRKHLDGEFRSKGDETDVNNLKMEILSFADQFDLLVDFVKVNTRSFRDKEALYSLCFKHRIPCKIYESQQSALEGIYEALEHLGEPFNLASMQYINDSEIGSFFERVMRAYPGMSPNRYEWIMNVLKAYNCNMSLDGISDFILEYEESKHILATDKFWTDFVKWFIDGKNPLTLKELKEQKKEIK